MRTRFHVLLANLFRPSPRPATLSIRPVLEQLEDRCVPSANMMQPMSMNMMNMQPMNTAMMSMQSMNTNMMNMPSMNMQPMTFQQEANIVAALDKVFVNFEQMVQKFITQEVAMVQTFLADSSSMTMPGAPMGGMK